eukprot:scaffold200933_cov46-Cyclotella_meneghiniana.AAC.1
MAASTLPTDESTKNTASTLAANKTTEHETDKESNHVPTAASTLATDESTTKTASTLAASKSTEEETDNIPTKAVSPQTESAASMLATTPPTFDSPVFTPKISNTTNKPKRKTAITCVETPDDILRQRTKLKRKMDCNKSLEKDVRDEFESGEMKAISGDDNKEPIVNDNDSAVGDSMDMAVVDMKTESRSDASEVPIRGDNDSVNAGMTTESSENDIIAGDDYKKEPVLDDNDNAEDDVEMTTSTSENKSNAGDSKDNADVEMNIVSSEMKKSDAEVDTHRLLAQTLEASRRRPITALIVSL